MKIAISSTIDQEKVASSLRQDYMFEVDKSKTKASIPNSNSQIEKVLLSSLKVGDYQAFSFIFNSYYKDLVIFATRFTKDLDCAEEIVQDIFVKLWEERVTVNINFSLRSFLLKTVQNRCIDWFRHRNIVQAHNEYVTENPNFLASETDNYLLYSELNEQIENAIKMLPEQVSEVFKMNRFQGLKYVEIAEILGVSVRTIEVRIGKALKLLRSYLKDYFIISLAIIYLIL